MISASAGGSKNRRGPAVCGYDAAQARRLRPRRCPRAYPAPAAASSGGSETGNMVGRRPAGLLGDQSPSPPGIHRLWASGIPCTGPERGMPAATKRQTLGVWGQSPHERRRRTRVRPVTHTGSRRPTTMVLVYRGPPDRGDPDEAVGCVRRGPPGTPLPACRLRRQTGRPACLADWTETMDTRTCLDAAALVKAAALDVHAQHHRLHQTELQWKDPNAVRRPRHSPRTRRVATAPVGLSRRSPKAKGCGRRTSGLPTGILPSQNAGPRRMRGRLSGGGSGRRVGQVVADGLRASGMAERIRPRVAWV